jgi:hypothetical protein
MNKQAIRGATQPPAPLEECLRTRIEWHQTGDAMEPWRSQVGRNLWTLHVNDFPEEHLYTLSINGRTVGDFDGWPPEWVKVDSEKGLSAVKQNRR